MKLKIVGLFIFFLLILNLCATANYGCELSLLGSQSLVAVPDAFRGLEADGGFGTDFGIGMYTISSKGFKVRVGLHRWSKRFEPSYEVDFNDENGHFLESGKVVEEGKISYTGMYLIINKMKNNFSFGAGFDLAFANSYKADRKYYDSSNYVFLKDNDVEESFVTKKFNNQFDLLFHMAYNIKIAEKISICPIFMFTIPCIALFDSNVQVYSYMDETTSEARLDIFQTKFGVSLEYKL